MTDGLSSHGVPCALRLVTLVSHPAPRWVAIRYFLLPVSGMMCCPTVGPCSTFWARTFLVFLRVKSISWKEELSATFGSRCRSLSFQLVGQKHLHSDSLKQGRLIHSGRWGGHAQVWKASRLSFCPRNNADCTVQFVSESVHRTPDGPPCTGRTVLTSPDG